MKKNLFVLGVLLMVLVGCGGSSLDNAISQVEKSTEKLTNSKGKMTEADWQSLQKETEAPLKVIADALQAGKVGAMDKIKIMAVMAQWSAAVMNAGFSEVAKQTDELGKSLENASKELEKVSSNLDSVIKTLPDTVK